MHTKTIFISLIFSIILSSCLISDGDKISDLDPADQGYSMYNYWNSSFTYRTAYLRKAFNLNAYIQATGDDDKQFEILSNYFAHQHIRNFGSGIWGIYNGTQLLYRFNTHEQALDEVDAGWIINASNTSIKDDNYNIDKIDIISGDSLDIYIRHHAEKYWSISYEDQGNPASYQSSNFYFPETTSIPTDLLDVYYELAGQGRFIFHDEDEAIALDYLITSTLKANDFNEKWLWSEGSLELTAANREGKDRNSEADFFFTGNWYTMDITSDDETETFDQSCSPNSFIE